MRSFRAKVPTEAPLAVERTCRHRRIWSPGVTPKKRNEGRRHGDEVVVVVRAPKGKERSRDAGASSSSHLRRKQARACVVVSRRPVTGERRRVVVVTPQAQASACVVVSRRPVTGERRRVVTHPGASKRVRGGFAASGHRRATARASDALPVSRPRAPEAVAAHQGGFSLADVLCLVTLWAEREPQVMMQCDAM